MIQLFTVGHSNLTLEIFIALLQRHQITAIADVRSHPYSRHLPHFNQSEIQAALLNTGIQYVFLGRELGARTEDLSCYDQTGKALYERIAATQLFADGIQRLLKGAQTYKIALMCAEKDPMTCHRSILICRHLRQHNCEINHILSDGSLELHHQLEKRLLEKFQKPIQLNLFEAPPEAVDLEKAYQKQGDEIAYVKNEKLEATP